MALALTIPGVVDSQDLHTVHPEPDGVSFAVTFDYNDTATKIMSAHQRGDPYELVVLTLDSGIMALDDVYVASASYTGGSSPVFQCSLQARAVRWV
jgi:hypothetical protein